MKRRIGRWDDWEIEDGKGLTKNSKMVEFLPKEGKVPWER